MRIRSALVTTLVLVYWLSSMSNAYADCRSDGVDYSEGYCLRGEGGSYQRCVDDFWKPVRKTVCEPDLVPEQKHVSGKNAGDPFGDLPDEPNVDFDPFKGEEPYDGLDDLLPNQN